MAKVLVVGQGGREHVLAWKLNQSPLVDEVFCAPGNAGTAADVTNVDIKSDDCERLVQFARENEIDLTVVGPEAPLVAGIVDQFKAAGLLVFGPSKAASALEGSKAFCKDIMRKANVPTADYWVFTDPTDAVQFIQEREEEAFVVKADGLAAGKGVSVCTNKADAIQAVHEMMTDNVFGDAGKKIVIEEVLEGQEVSILALIDGRTIVTLEPAQDHKAAHDGDTGPNTGGMGSHSPAFALSDELRETIVTTVIEPTIAGMAAEGREYRGILYAGLMLTSDGPKVLEFNCRLGDPETQSVLRRFSGDLATVFAAAADGRLEPGSMGWIDDAAACVVLAAEGYPEGPRVGDEITGVDDADAIPGVVVFHAGTRNDNGGLLTSGGRVLSVTATGATLEEAVGLAYRAADTIRYDGIHRRSDIGADTMGRKEIG